MHSKDFSNSEDQFDFAIAIVVLVLAGILIGYFSFYSDDSLGGDTDLVAFESKIDTLELDGLTYVAMPMALEEISSTDRLQKLKEGQKEEISVVDTLTGKNTMDESMNDDETESADIDVDGTDSEDIGITESSKDLLDSIIDEEDSLPMYEDVVIDTSSSDVKENVTIETSAADTEPTEAVSEAETTAQPQEEPKPKIQQKPRSSRQSKCIVVIGAYSSQLNAKKMIGRLDKDGYPIFKVPYKGLTRVGAYVDCASSESILAEIRRKYGQDAFLMKAN